MDWGGGVEAIQEKDVFCAMNLHDFIGVKMAPRRLVECFLFLTKGNYSGDKLMVIGWCIFK